MIGEMFAENAESFANFILSSNYTTLVDPSLTIGVKDEYIKELEVHERRLEQMSAMNDLKLSQSTMIQTLHNIYDLINRLGNDVGTTNPSSHISTEQAAFIDRILQCVLTIQSYYSLLDHMPLINEGYAKLTSLALLKELHNDTLETLFKSSTKSNSQDFESMVTRHTDETYDLVHGIDIVREKVKTLINCAPIIDDGYVFVIMCGPPGTGKSLLSHCIASAHSNGNYYNFHIAELSSGTVGETEHNILKIFEGLENCKEPKTIIFDEMDNLFSNNGTEPPHIRSLKVTIQTEVSGARKLKNNVVLIGLTNYLDQIDDTIKRRATAIVNVPLPEPDAAYKFLMYKLNVDSSMLTDEFKTELSKMIHLPEKKFTNASVISLLKNAKNNFLQRQATNSFQISDSLNHSLIIQSNSLKGINTNWTLITIDGLKRSAMESGRKLIIIPEVEDFIEALKNTHVLDDQSLEEYTKRNAVQTKE